MLGRCQGRTGRHKTARVATQVNDVAGGSLSMQAVQCGSRIMPSICSKGLDCYIPDRGIRPLSAGSNRSLTSCSHLFRQGMTCQPHSSLAS